jgi:hypothetical protein
LFLTLIISFIGFSCKKEIPRQPIKKAPIFLIESFRQSGMSDQEVIQFACDSVPENSILKFGNKTYNIDHTIFVYKSLKFTGPATLRRENQVDYQLTEPANENSRQLVLNTTEGLKVRDYFLLTNGQKDYKGTTSMNLITAINGNTVTTFYPIGKFINGSADYAAGTYFLKDVKFFWVTDKNPGIFPTQSCSFVNLTFDGNRYHNQGSYSWLLHYGILAASKEKTIIDSCTFMNNPAENVLGHNLHISNSIFRNLNGSAIHTSIDRLHVTEDEIHSEFVNNYFENTNEILTKIGGHSEGCITHSNSGGYYTAKNNTFINVGEAVIGLLYPSVSKNDWGTSEIIFTDNIIRTSGRMVYSFGILPGKLENIRIVDNEVFKLNPWDWANALDYYPGVELDNQVNQ